jgi:hypothetical protein
MNERHLNSHLHYWWRKTFDGDSNLISQPPVEEGLPPVDSNGEEPVSESEDQQLGNLTDDDLDNILNNEATYEQKALEKEQCIEAP